LANKNDCFCLFITGYKWRHYKKEREEAEVQKAGKAPKKTKTAKEKEHDYEREYKDDCAVIEHLCATGLKEGEVIYARDMYPEAAARVARTMKCAVNDVFPIEKVDQREGLRTLLFLLLQVCIIVNEGEALDSLEGGLHHLWKTFHKIVKDEKDAKNRNKEVYWSLAHHMFNLTVGFQNTDVSTVF
jgi:hypothetical protein